MRRFRFRLQTLLDQRKTLEDERLRELGALRQEEAAEAERLTRLQNDLQNAWSGIVAAVASGASADEMARRDEHARTVREDLKLQEVTLEAVRERVEAKRLELVEAMKQRKVLETLKDNQERAYIAECERADRNVLDDLGSLRYARGM